MSRGQNFGRFVISKFLEGLAFSAMHGNGAYLSGLGNFFCTGFAIMSQNSGKCGKSKAEVDRCTLRDKTNQAWNLSLPLAGYKFRHKYRYKYRQNYRYKHIKTNTDTNADKNRDTNIDTNTAAKSKMQ